MTVASVEQMFSGKIQVGSEVTVRGWVRTRRDSKAGLSFVSVSDGSCFAAIQVVTPAHLPNYETEVRKLYHRLRSHRDRHPGTLSGPRSTVRNPGPEH